MAWCRLFSWTREMDWVRRGGRQGSEGMFGDVFLLLCSSPSRGRELDSVCSSFLDIPSLLTCFGFHFIGVYSLETCFYFAGAP